jgi:uncharacterized protein YihD (DUF1040 family)
MQKLIEKLDKLYEQIENTDDQNSITMELSKITAKSAVETFKTIFIDWHKQQLAAIDAELAESRKYCEPEFTAALQKARGIIAGEGD